MDGGFTDNSRYNTSKDKKEGLVILSLVLKQAGFKNPVYFKEIILFATLQKPSKNIESYIVFNIISNLALYKIIKLFCKHANVLLFIYFFRPELERHMLSFSFTSIS